MMLATTIHAGMFCNSAVWMVMLVQWTCTVLPTLARVASRLHPGGVHWTQVTPRTHRSLKEDKWLCLLMALTISLLTIVWTIDSPATQTFSPAHLTAPNLWLRV